MPFCPSCRYEYREGVKTCPDCGLDLVPGLASEERIEEDLVPVYSVDDDMEAQMVKNILEEAGIPVWEKAEFVSGLDPFPVDPVPSDAISVPVSRAEEARRIIEEALRAASRMPVNPKIEGEAEAE